MSNNKKLNQKKAEGVNMPTNKFVIWVVAIVLVLVGVCFVVRAGIRGYRMLEYSNKQAAENSWRLLEQDMYKMAPVSDDGEWFLMHEARIRFPYFVPTHEGNGTARPLRYKYIGNDKANEFAGPRFEILITYDVLDDEINKDFPKGCVGTFALIYNLPDYSISNDQPSGFERVTDITLADGRVVELWKNTRGTCLDPQQEVQLQDILLERLRDIESY